MSLIRCTRCRCIIDAKNEGIDGIYGDNEPWEYICPDCVYNIAADAKIKHPIEYQDQRVIRAYRSRPL